MQIDTNTIRKLAHLSRLQFDEEQEQKMVASLNNIIAWVDKLNEVDTTGIEPLTHLTHEINSFREDVAMPPLAHEKGLLNAPKHDKDYFRVPKVVE